MGGDDPGQMCGATGSCDDHANAAISRFAREFCGSLWRTVGRGDINFIADPETLKRLGGFAHDLKIGVASHHN